MTHELLKTLALTLLVLAGACRSGAENRSAARPDDAASLEARPAEAAARAFDKPGFRTSVVDGRLWVFRAGSDDLDAFLGGAEPAKHVTLVGAGPQGMNLRGVERETLDAYVCAQAGFVTEIADAGGRRILWVFRDGSDALAAYRADGEPAQSVTLTGAGPMGITLRGAERETLDAYLAAR